MSRKTTVVGQLVLEALDKFPKAGSQTIAKALCAKYPEVFVSLEQARSAVRRQRGATGNRERRYATKTRSKEDAEECQRFGVLLPEPEHSAWAWFDLPERVKRWLLIADLHNPYHDAQSIKIVVERNKREVDGIAILGDFMDCHHLSNFCRDPRNRSFAKEIDSGKQMLDYLQHELQPKETVLKLGNHEGRLLTYLMQRAPELFPAIADKVNWETLLGLGERRIKCVRHQDPMRHRQLTLVHGHEWGKGLMSPVNPARGAFLRAQECTISGHLHRKSNHAEMSIRGRLVQNWSLGCLCQLHPDYAPLNKWDQGYAILNSGDDWSVENYSIINGKVL